MNFFTHPTLISLVGPTAVGKTRLSILVAEELGAEILSADSRQMYRQLDLGTAKPGAADLARVPHHFIDWLSPEEELNAGSFLRAANERLVKLFSCANQVVAVGGSTLYFHALWHGLNDMPEVPEDIRSQLMAVHRDQGLPALLDELEKVDPATFAVIDRHNPARVIRALEVFRASGHAISSFRNEKPGAAHASPWRHLKVGLYEDRDTLYRRIDARVDAMFDAGLEEEVKGLLDLGLSPDCQSLRSIGYQELVQFFLGAYDREEAIRLVKRNSRRYAKRQLTWFRRYHDITWFQAGAEQEVMRFIRASAAITS